MDADEYVETYVSDLETGHVYEGEQPVDAPQVLAVSTANAEYSLHPAAHYAETDIADALLETVDGIVLEAASPTYEEAEFEWFAELDQYAHLVEQNLDSYQSPIYVADMPTTEETAVDRHLPTDDDLYKNIARMYAVEGVPLTAGIHGLIAGWLSAGEAVPLMMPAALLLASSVAAKGHLTNTIGHLRVAAAYNPISGGRSSFTAKNWMNTWPLTSLTRSVRSRTFSSTMAPLTSISSRTCNIHDYVTALPPSINGSGHHGYRRSTAGK